MNPAFSVVLFTTIAGAAQGLVVALALAVLGGTSLAPSFLSLSLAIAVVMLLVGLGASFLHLGRPERAWRAVLMWRTSWLSREVIVLPAFIGIVALWWLALRSGFDTPVLPLLAIVMAGVLWYCTAMIYACLRFIQEWAHPLTLINYTLIGLASGWLLACALATLAGEPDWALALGPWALVMTLAAAVSRMLSLRRNAGLVPKSTLQSATGIRATPLVQTSMGMSAGAFNTREFFHGVTVAVLGKVKLGFVLLGFVFPLLLMGLAVLTGAGWPWVLALLVQAPGLLAERWFFFAQARHPQNLYYQVVS
jgi:sulfite dehydrogenase (quinone) subunit SoeC